MSTQNLDLDEIHGRVEAAIDPLGLFAPIVHAQLAWLAHPEELAKTLTQASGLAWQLAAHNWRRSLGLVAEDVISPHGDDTRFSDPVWRQYPSFDVLKENYLALTHQMQDMLYETPGLSNRERRRAAFWWRKWLNAMAPTNFFWTNPVAIRKCVETGGDSLRRGMQNLLADLRAGNVRMTDPGDFQVGRNLAMTPGAVVFRNRLFELIQYRPTTASVRETPVVLITPWINRYYIVDLTQKKSLVRYLLDQGFSVFVTSWKNPGAEMAATQFEDYLTEGVIPAIDVARAVTGAAQAHAVGYCIGGTLLAAYMAWAHARYGKSEQMPVVHWTLFTTLVDFHKPGDIEVFIDEASIAYIEAGMKRQGFLDGSQMAAAFRLLRSNSLIWHYVVHSYLYGEKPPPFDVLYWNMDTTRMPAAMHGWYLRELYLRNRLIRKGGVNLAGESIDLGRITQPLYCVAAEDDHIAPWRSVFRINNLVNAPKRFVLSSSGHILGIINPPVKPPKRHYWVAEAHRSETAESWRDRAGERNGSWWEDWVDWLHKRCGNMVDAPGVGNASFPELLTAPGSYVLER